MSKELAVEMLNISMKFNEKTYANKNVNFSVLKGEVHALVGENGAGKSTLLSVLFGIYEPTFGEIKINGIQQNISNPIVANSLKIGMVHQHFHFVEIFKLWENISLGAEIKKLKLFNNKKQIIKKISIIMKENDLTLNLNKLAKNASVGELQKAEILKLLYRDSEILIFDEPTAVLTPLEIEGFLNVLKTLKNNGKTIILISHKMKEIEKVADRATVIRKGEIVGTYNMNEVSIDDLSVKMVGRNLKVIKNTHNFKGEEQVLKINNINVTSINNKKIQALKNFSLDIKAGEILGIAGVEGNGQSELANVISGLQKVKSGEIFIKNIKINDKSIYSRFHTYKMSHIPLDRQKHGLILDFNVLENSVLQDIGEKPFSNKLGIINKYEIKKRGLKIINKYDVRDSNGGYAITRSLSGGNQQKLIIGRELSRESDFILIYQPTRGLDVGSIEFIHSQIIEAKKKNKAILLISYELSEIINLSDRVIVINSGNVVGELVGNKINYDLIGKMMMGNN
ncbi:ABC transporter ATP-binding protein [Spiroplasma turonicum]|uniref:Ribose/galactose ABC transporter ATP-binding protein n=1 Tax=Spiroplasma turonicum TaxID=216946 RepID=A0A0K1P5V9_9MOLU|nr:ABC transporter ATP-binding protein [Spiroplasma turonicum]AKU79645.1 ribose/galactose ABC transporter ATP-binding protein [Spiroplasma turonicum]ALX70666.1 sugar ABC transporter ATP-binding protein [Spiroplasma turonicum]